jgi:hypothetical protein
MVLPDSARLPVDALARLVSEESIGQLPDVIAPAAAWRPQDEMDAGKVLAYEEAARCGWLDRGGRLDVEVVESLSVLCRAGVEFSGWIASQENGTVGVLAGARGREGILAVREGGDVRLRRAQPKKLAEALVAQLPELPAGAGVPLSVPVEELRAAAERRPGAVNVQPVPRAEVRQVLRVAELAATGSGELWVAVRDKVGRRRQVSHPLRYADTEWGRFLNLVKVADGGEQWFVVAPASRGELVARLRSLHQELMQAKR